MGYRQVIVKKAERISLGDNQLIIKRDDVTRIPLEDINFIVLEDPMTVVTTRLLAELGKYYISLLVCNEVYEPSSLLFSFNNHYKQLAVFQYQIKDHSELNGSLWKAIVQYKISNALVVLGMTSNDTFSMQKLTEYLKEIEENDSTNREGLAAKVYFRGIFGHEFLRFSEDAVNAALNYGYTIFKSALVRSLTAHGFHTYLGIHHCSKTNNFNLAFDFLEPYRAVIDYYVYCNMDRVTYPLSFEIRRELIDLLNYNVVIQNKKCTVQYSFDVMIESYIRSLEKEENLLLLPSLEYE